MSEYDLFSQMMGEVTPLTTKGKVQANKTPDKHAILRGLEEKEHTHQHITQTENLKPQRAETWQLRAGGVASKDIKKLGQENLTYELDLHGLTQDSAIQALNTFIAKALSQNIRQVCIVHGKGNHSEGDSVLKKATYHWLEFGDYSSFILAATPAIQSKGGACNILLRKQNN